MRILVSFPGKHGDLLWALPAIRAIAESLEGEPIDLLVGAPYAGICDLITRQPYIRVAIEGPSWRVQDTAPMSPRVPSVLPPVSYDYVFHLGYKGWPAVPLPLETYACLAAQWPTGWPSLRPLDLDRPWIQIDPIATPKPIALGWTDEHFELKVGLTSLFLLQAQDPSRIVNLSWSPRWQTEWWEPSWGHAAQEAEGMLGSWRDAARILAGAQVFCGDCSALHVLACALGIPTVIMEPNPHRHHPIFYPYGMDGRRVQVVRGVDGLPTFDARHTWEAIQARLQEIPA